MVPVRLLFRLHHLLVVITGMILISQTQQEQLCEVKVPLNLIRSGGQYLGESSIIFINVWGDEEVVQRAYSGTRCLSYFGTFSLPT